MCFSVSLAFIEILPHCNFNPPLRLGFLLYHFNSKSVTNCQSRARALSLDFHME